MINATDTNIGFDSLLDTMTNAVGILIVVLAVAYLFVIDTVDRVAKLDPMSSLATNQEYQQLQAESERLDRLFEQVEREWKAAQRHAQYHGTQLAQIQNNISILKNLLSQDELSRINIQDIAQGLQKNRMKPQQLKDEVYQLKEQMKQVQNTINFQRDLPTPKITIARVPDPTPAPEGAKRLTFLCRYGRMVYYPTDKMIQLLHKGISEATGSELSNPEVRIRDFEKVVNYFNTHETALGGLRWRLSVFQRVDAANVTHRALKAFLEWTTPEVGESLEDIQKDGSQYRKILTDYADQHVYAKYYVWGDSFPEYAIAREIADEKNIPAGWVAKEGDAEYILTLTNIQTGGKKRPEVPDKIRQMPVPKIFTGGRIGVGAGGSTSFTPAAGGGAVGIIGASPGGDFVD